MITISPDVIAGIEYAVASAFSSLLPLFALIIGIKIAFYAIERLRALFPKK